MLGLLLAIQILSMPFYSGAGGSVGMAHMLWRLEHGRLRVTCRESGNPESFYIANNGEGLRWEFEGSLHGWRDWSVNVPLWAMMIPAAGVVVWGWRRVAVPKQSGSHEVGSP